MKSIYQTIKFPGRALDLFKTMQVMFDEASKRQVILFEKTYIEQWFDVMLPQYGLTVESIIGKSRIRFMASIIGDDSKAPLRPNAGFDVWKGEIPRMGHSFVRTAKELRRMLEIMESPRFKEDAKIKELEKSLTTEVKDAYLGCKDTVVHVVLQALSNNGIAVFNSLNNADGREYKVDYSMPDENKRKADLAWTDANADEINVLEILQNIKYEYEEKGVIFGEMLMAPELLHWILRTKMLRTIIHGDDKKSGLVTEAMFNSVLTEWGLPTVTKIQKKNAVQKDGKRSLVNPWNSDMICLKPAGKIGEIQPAFEDNEIMPEGNVEYMNAGDGIRVAKWRVGESTGQTPGEYTQASWRAIPKIEAIDNIVCLQVRGEGIPLTKASPGFAPLSVDLPITAQTPANKDGEGTDETNLLNAGSIDEATPLINQCDDLAILNAALADETGKSKPRSGMIELLHNRIAALSAPLINASTNIEELKTALAEEMELAKPNAGMIELLNNRIAALENS